MAAARGEVFRHNHYGDIRQILNHRLDIPEPQMALGLRPAFRACSGLFNDADDAGFASPPVLLRSPAGWLASPPKSDDFGDARFHESAEIIPVRMAYFTSPALS